VWSALGLHRWSLHCWRSRADIPDSWRKGKGIFAGSPATIGCLNRRFYIDPDRTFSVRHGTTVSVNVDTQVMFLRFKRAVPYSLTVLAKNATVWSVSNPILL